MADNDDGWSDSDVEVVPETGHTASGVTGSQDLFSEEPGISQFSLNDDDDFLETDQLAKDKQQHQETNNSQEFGSEFDADIVVSGANTDWLNASDENLSKSQRKSQRIKSSVHQQGNNGKTGTCAPPAVVEPESQWSQDFPDDVVEGTRQDSLATLSPDQTQPPQRYRLEDLPKFSFLDKVTKMDADGLVSPIPYKKLKSFVSTPSPAPPPVSNKTPGSTKRLGSRFLYPSSTNSASATSINSSDSPLMIDPNLMRPSPSNKKPDGTPNPSLGSRRRLSEHVMKPSPLLSGRGLMSGKRGLVRDEAEESPLDVRLDVLDPRAAADTHDETLLTNASVSSAATDKTIYRPGRLSSQRIQYVNNDSVMSADISMKQTTSLSIHTESMVPASFTMDSLELSPSFRALAEELDNPQIRPSDTQMRLIERELDLIAETEGDLSGWGSMPNVVTQPANKRKSRSQRVSSQSAGKRSSTDNIPAEPTSGTDERAADSPDQESGVIYGTLDTDNVPYTPSPPRHEGTGSHVTHNPAAQQKTSATSERVNNDANTGKQKTPSDKTNSRRYSDSKASRTPNPKNHRDNTNKKTPKPDQSSVNGAAMDLENKNIKSAKNREITKSTQPTELNCVSNSTTPKPSLGTTRDHGNPISSMSKFSVPDLESDEDDLAMSSITPVTKSRRQTQRKSESGHEKSRSRSRSRSKTPAKSGLSLNDSLDSIPMPEEDSSPIIPLLKAGKHRAKRTPVTKLSETPAAKSRNRQKSGISNTENFQTDCGSDFEAVTSNLEKKTPNNKSTKCNKKSKTPVKTSKTPKADRKEGKTPKSDRKEKNTPQPSTSPRKARQPSGTHNKASASMNKKTPTKLQEDLDVSIDLTMSDEDEAAGVVTRKSSELDSAQVGQVDLTHDSDSDHVPSGSEEMGSLESGEPRRVTKNPGNAAVIKRRCIIESDSESDNLSNAETRPAQPTPETGEKEVKKSRFNFKSVSQLSKTRKNVDTDTKGAARDEEIPSSVKKTPQTRQPTRRGHYKTPTNHVTRDDIDLEDNSKAVKPETPSKVSSTLKKRRRIRTPNKETIETSPVRHQDQCVSSSASVLNEDNTSVQTESSVNTPKSTPRRSGRISKIESEKKSKKARKEDQLQYKPKALETSYYSPGTPATQQQLAALVEATLSPLQTISANVTHTVSAGKRRQKPKHKEEALLLDDFISTAPEKELLPRSDPTNQVQSLLDFLEDTASALQPLPDSPGGLDTSKSSLSVTETETTKSSVAAIDVENTVSTVYSTSSAHSSPEAKEAEKPKSLSVRRAISRTQNDNSDEKLNEDSPNGTPEKQKSNSAIKTKHSEQPDPSVSKNRRNKSASKSPEALTFSGGEQDSKKSVKSHQKDMLLARYVETIERVASDNDLMPSKETLLDRESFVELMYSTPRHKTKDDKPSEDFESSSLVAENEQKDQKSAHHETAQSDDESLEATVDDLIGRSNSRRSDPTRLDSTTPTNKRKRKSTGDEVIRDHSKSERRSLPADIVNMFSGKSPATDSKKTPTDTNKSRRKGKKTPEDKKENSDISKSSEDESSYELPRRKLQKKEPFWLAKFSVSRDRNKDKDDTQTQVSNTLPTQAEAVCNLFVKSYSGKRYRDQTAAVSAKPGPPDAPSCEPQPSTSSSGDTSVYDFIPSQPSPVKTKKSKSSKKSAVSGVTSGRVTKPTKPRKNSKAEKAKKQQLIAQLNHNWGIDGTSHPERAADTGTEATTEPPMSQATALKHHINDIDDNVELTVEKKDTRKHCRFRSRSTELKTPTKDDKSKTAQAAGRETIISSQGKRDNGKTQKRESKGSASRNKSSKQISEAQSAVSVKSPIKDSHKSAKISRAKTDDLNELKSPASPAVTPQTPDNTQRRSKRRNKNTDSVVDVPLLVSADNIKTEIGGDAESPSSIQVTQKVQLDIRSFMKPDAAATKITDTAASKTARTKKPDLVTNKDKDTTLVAADTLEESSVSTSSLIGGSRRRRGLRNVIQESDTDTTTTSANSSQTKTNKKEKLKKDGVSASGTDSLSESTISSASRSKTSNTSMSSSNNTSKTSSQKSNKTTTSKASSSKSRSSLTINTSKASSSNTSSSTNATQSQSPIQRPRRRNMKSAVISSESETSTVCEKSQSEEKRAGSITRKPAEKLPTSNKTKVGRLEDSKSQSKSLKDRVNKDSSFRNTSQIQVKVPTVKETGRSTRNTQVGVKLVFTTSSLSSQEKVQVEKCAAILEAKVVPQYTPEVTHVITSTDSQNCCPRTLKYMLAVLESKWVVTSAWPLICLEDGERALEEAFVVDGSSAAPQSYAVIKSRQHHADKVPRLFSGCEIYLSGDFSAPCPPKDHLIQLIQAGGGKVLHRHPREASSKSAHHAEPGSTLSQSGTVIICNGGDNIADRIEGVTYAHSSWLLNCIAHYNLLHTD